MGGKILTISSHVVHGYVGNRAITFPLQYLGWDVDALNTTNLSNHPGYGSFTGKIENPETINEILIGLENIGEFLKNYDIVITGYLPNFEIISSVEKMLMKLGKSNNEQGKSPIIVMDPILGDNGKLYLLELVVPVYKRILKSGLIDLITPNQFEFEYLSNTKITDIESLKNSIKTFKSLYNVKNIVISSINIGESMYCIGLEQSKNEQGKNEQGKKEQDNIIMIPIKEIPVKFFGCGDLFTGLMAHNFKSLNFKDAITQSVDKLSKVLERTIEFEPNTKVIKDLKIVQLRDIY